MDMMVQGTQSPPWPNWGPPDPNGSCSAIAAAAGATAVPQSSGLDVIDVDNTVMSPPPVLGKRKAESQDNERLSKRLSLLNLEQNGNKLYVPVETPSSHHAPTVQTLAQASANESMQVDDSKYKVYIYNLDDELSSEGEEEKDGRLVFLPDIQKHLRDNRIPPHVLANPDGELAGMQLVVYSEPRSLTVPEEQDGVRKAILEARHRARQKQRLELQGGSPDAQSLLPSSSQHHDYGQDMDMD